MANADNGDSKIKEFLARNIPSDPIKNAWQELILEDPKARGYLLKALEQLEEKKQRAVCLPADGLILKSLTFRPPNEIKAIIVAHDPEIQTELASGLAFSFPSSFKNPQLENYLTTHGEKAVTYGLQQLIEFIYKKKRNSSRKPRGFAMVVMKIALLRAEAEKVGDLNFCYEEQWAAKGVLLLNAALTVFEGEKDPSKKHDFWIPFTARLIFLVLRESCQKSVLGMFWGTFAKKVFDQVEKHNVEAGVSVHKNCRHYHHPTHPKDVTNNFIKNAVQDFQKLYGFDEISESLGAVSLEEKGGKERTDAGKKSKGVRSKYQ